MGDVATMGVVYKLPDNVSSYPSYGYKTTLANKNGPGARRSAHSAQMKQLTQGGERSSKGWIVFARRNIRLSGFPTMVEQATRPKFDWRGIRLNDG